MTCLEVWRKMHPDHTWTEKDIIKNECPNSYGIMPAPDWGCGDCEECWSREVPNLNRFDRDTALAVLKEFSRDMYPSNDIFGHKTLVISRGKFEAIRKKFLDKNEQTLEMTIDEAKTNLITNWTVEKVHDGFVVCGKIYNDQWGRFDDGTPIRTSRVIYINFVEKIVKTLNSTYNLE